MSNTNEAKPLPIFYVAGTTGTDRITRFLANRHVAMSDDAELTDTTSIWYTIQHIQELYEELLLLNADGLRVYFGVYGPEETDRYPGQTCLVMRATRGAPNEQHVDVIMENEPNFEARMEATIEQNMDFNFGNPCPPLCP